jgi:hypothetical protein
MNFEDKTQLIHLIIRVSKENSHFVYFVLEANEGLCFYSTLDVALGATFCEIDITGSMEFKDEILRLLSKIHENYPIDILVSEVIYDKP